MESAPYPSAATLAHWEKKAPHAVPGEFVPLHLETRTHVDTETMCWHLGFAQQTARLWACKETYPEGLRPIRVNGRLKWPVAGIRKTLGVA
jgi:hypothetical protein